MLAPITALIGGEGNFTKEMVVTEAVRSWSNLQNKLAIVCIVKAQQKRLMVMMMASVT
jgi:hypothetical protein